MFEEEWATVESHAGFLEVSNLGRVRSLDSFRPGRGAKPHPQLRKGKVLSPFIANNGYPTIAPKFGDSRKKLLVHRLVAKAFVPGYFDGATVNHIDGDKTNNTAGNLEWTTRADNTAHQWVTGLVNIRGERHPSAKLSNSDVGKVRSMFADGVSQAEIARQFAVSDTLIWAIKHGRKRTTYKGSL